MNYPKTKENNHMRKWYKLFFPWKPYQEESWMIKHGGKKKNKDI